MPEPLPAEQRRVSHADRDLVAEQLREAAGDGRLSIAELDERLESAFAARTYGELALLTHDLPDADVPAAVPDRTPGTGARGQPQRVTGREGRRWSLAIMSGSSHQGHWVLAKRHTAIAVMGGVELDLRDAELETADVTIWAFALMGGVDVTVPADCAVDAGGLGLMGGFGQSDQAPPAPSGAPVVRLRGLALMGGVSAIRRAAPRSDSAIKGAPRPSLGDRPSQPELEP